MSVDKSIVKIEHLGDWLFGRITLIENKNDTETEKQQRRRERNHFLRRYYEFYHCRHCGRAVDIRRHVVRDAYSFNNDSCFVELKCKCRALKTDMYPYSILDDPRGDKERRLIKSVLFLLNSINLFSVTKEWL